MTTPVEQLANLVVGTVESVSSDDIRVLLELDAPQSTALNTGTPTPFPRLNGYVLIPNEAGATVAYVAWVGIERSPYPKRAGLKDFGLIDLPFPLRKMRVTPVGTLAVVRSKDMSERQYALSRGVLAFPSVGDQVLIPTPAQIAAIVGSGDTNRRIRIGRSALTSDAPIRVDPNKLFGRHLAVLGNTGSGKSCTVAGLIRWSMEAAEEAVRDAKVLTKPNARFIVLDPNGEYAAAFADRGDKLRVFRVPPVGDGERALDVPAWLWSGHEWTAVAQAQPGAQRPLLLQGLRELKSGSTEEVPREAMIRRYLTSYRSRISGMLAVGTQAFAGSPRPRFECARLLEKIASDAVEFAAETDEPARQGLTSVADRATEAVEGARSGRYFDDFAVKDLEDVRDGLTTVIDVLPDFGTVAPIGEDVPLFFDVNLLAEHLDRIAEDRGGNITGFISTLGLRIRGMLADPRLGAVIGRDPATSFRDWLTDYVGADRADNGELAIIDLSLVPSEIIHIVVAVLARLIFESLQRYRREHTEGKSLPTVLVLEEAHTFVRRIGGEEADAHTPAQLCRQVFERIAREGRKFGLGLVLSSQRPSELSPTALAQCNTFLLHRIVNDSDQQLVSRLVPDNVSGLLRDLPSLPTRQAILLGWATPIPVLVEVDELPSEQRPRSSDPDFWGVWVGEAERRIDWDAVVRDWTGGTTGEGQSTAQGEVKESDG